MCFESTRSCLVDCSILINWTSLVYFFLYILFLMKILYANSVDPDQMLCSEASDLGLHCLPRSPEWDARHKRFMLDTILLKLDNNNWAASWQNQQNDSAPSRDSDQPGHPPVWSESLLCAQWLVKDPVFLYVDSKDSDQTGRMPRLIWAFAGCTCLFVGFVMRWLNLHSHFLKIGELSADLYTKILVETAQNNNAEATCSKMQLPLLDSTIQISDLCCVSGERKFLHTILVWSLSIFYHLRQLLFLYPYR